MIFPLFSSSKLFFAAIEDEGIAVEVLSGKKGLAVAHGSRRHFDKLSGSSP
jgi:hypothetical protein